MKLPIVVIGTGPRCGSTPYVQLLSQQLNLPAFYEPWNIRICKEPSHSQHYLSYLNFKERSNNYIVKFWINELEHRAPYHADLKKGYKILLMRKDIVGQIASWYIADCRNKFHTLVSEEIQDYTVDINVRDISFLIKILTRSLFFAEHSNIFDKRIYYEDINFSSLKTKYKKTIQPRNLIEIKKEIEKQLKDTIPTDWLINKYNYT